MLTLNAQNLVFVAWIEFWIIFYKIDLHFEWFYTEQKINGEIWRK